MLWRRHHFKEVSKSRCWQTDCFNWQLGVQAYVSTFCDNHSSEASLWLHIFSIRVCQPATRWGLQACLWGAWKSHEVTCTKDSESSHVRFFCLMSNSSTLCMTFVNMCALNILGRTCMMRCALTGYNVVQDQCAGPESGCKMGRHHKEGESYHNTEQMDRSIQSQDRQPYYTLWNWSFRGVQDLISGSCHGSCHGVTDTLRTLIRPNGRP